MIASALSILYFVVTKCVGYFLVVGNGSSESDGKSLLERSEASIEHGVNEREEGLGAVAEPEATTESSGEGAGALAVPLLTE